MGVGVRVGQTVPRKRQMLQKGSRGTSLLNVHLLACERLQGSKCIRRAAGGVPPQLPAFAHPTWPAWRAARAAA